MKLPQKERAPAPVAPAPVAPALVATVTGGPVPGGGSPETPAAPQGSETVELPQTAPAPVASATGVPVPGGGSPVTPGPGAARKPETGTIVTIRSRQRAQYHMYTAVVLESKTSQCWVRLLEGPCVNDRKKGRVKLPFHQVEVMKNPPARYTSKIAEALRGSWPLFDVPAVASCAVPPGSALPPAAPALPPAAPAASALDPSRAPLKAEMGEQPAGGASSSAAAAAQPTSSPFTSIMEMLQKRDLGNEL